jgi:hypothetical protein
MSITRVLALKPITSGAVAWPAARVHGASVPAAPVATQLPAASTANATKVRFRTRNVAGPGRCATGMRSTCVTLMATVGTDCTNVTGCAPGAASSRMITPTWPMPVPFGSSCALTTTLMVSVSPTWAGTSTCCVRDVGRMVSSRTIITTSVSTCATVLCRFSAKASSSTSPSVPNGTATAVSTRTWAGETGVPPRERSGQRAAEADHHGIDADVVVGRRHGYVQRTTVDHRGGHGFAVERRDGWRHHGRPLEHGL